ncbi:hypothetical protein [Paratractidigestivibacter sp.]|uniref:hypothetical protein n=1 Tax=Paratractidigestivibacter sp. TaxID=2847316 RepID=UPI002AC931AA|nr:hypothetical protein [Paratractidigestivibacter sp.]
MKRLPVAMLLLAGALVTGALRRIRNVDGFCERRSGSIDHLPRRHLAFAVGPGRHRADHDDRLARFLRGASRREQSTPLPRHAASLIDKTWLGPADEVGDEISGEKFKGSKPRK